MRLRYLKEARKEFRESIRYYNSQQPGLGDEFRAEVESTIRRIEDNPEAWQIVEEDIRRCRVKRFPYVVIYRYLEDEIVVAAISHARRAPDHWKDRL